MKLYIVYVLHIVYVLCVGTYSTCVGTVCAVRMHVLYVCKYATWDIRHMCKYSTYSTYCTCAYARTVRTYLSGCVDASAHPSKHSMSNPLLPFQPSTVYVLCYGEERDRVERKCECENMRG